MFEINRSLMADKFGRASQRLLSDNMMRQCQYREIDENNIDSEF